jgi:hypothetical protein
LALEPLCFERALLVRSILTACHIFDTPLFGITECERDTASGPAVSTGYTIGLRKGIGLMGPMPDPEPGQENTRTLEINQVWLDETGRLVDLKNIGEIDPTIESADIRYQHHRHPTSDGLTHLNMLLEDAQQALAYQALLAGQQRMQSTKA